jgi:hypothetical protein
MLAKPRLVSPAPASTHSAAPPAGDPPAAYQCDTGSSEPFWPRLGRAAILLCFAVSLHIWGVRSPQQQEPVYSILASRVISSILVAPPVPLAPSLQIVSTRRSTERVTLQTSILNVPALPGPPIPMRSARIDRAVVPVGTMGALARASVIDASPKLPSAGAMLIRLNASAEPVVETGLPGKTPVFPAAPSAIEPRSEPAPAPAERVVPTPDRHVAATSGSSDAAPLSALEEQRRQKEGVLAVVHQYARALEKLDVGAAKAVYPTVDGRELRRAFDGLKGQQYYIASCGVSFSSSGDDAHARCKGNATFRPKIGPRIVRVTDYEWVISLARGGGGWQILEARIQ